jgi:hypothetical protein
MPPACRREAPWSQMGARSLGILDPLSPRRRPSEFDNSGSPSMTPNRQARNQKEKLRPEIPVPHKETVASLDEVFLAL